MHGNNTGEIGDEPVLINKLPSVAIKERNRINRIGMHIMHVNLCLITKSNKLGIDASLEVF